MLAGTYKCSFQKYNKRALLFQKKHDFLPNKEKMFPLSPSYQHQSLADPVSLVVCFSLSYRKFGKLPRTFQNFPNYGELRRILEKSPEVFQSWPNLNFIIEFHEICETSANFDLT
jgi:hypothetical protein